MAEHSAGGRPTSSGPLEYLRASLVGVSQVFFISNIWTALIFLVAIFWDHWVYGLAALIGTLVSTASAYFIGLPGDDIQNGLYGFNGTLVGICLSCFLSFSGPSTALWIFVVLGAALSTLLEAAVVHFLNPYGIPASTGPFVLTGWIMLAVVWAFTAVHPAAATAHLSAAHLPAFPQVGQPVTLQTFYTGFFKGIGEVMFMDNAVSGALLLLGIFIGNWQGGIMAILGAAVGVILPAVLGANTDAIQAGLFAFNPTLAAMALGAVYFKFMGRSVVYGLVAAVVSLLVTPGITAVAGLLGLPSLTAPYVFTVYMLMGAGNVGENLHQAHKGRIRSESDAT